MNFGYDPDKNRWLLENRGIGFEEVIEAIDSGVKIVEDVNHFNKTKYPNQRIFILRIRNYIFMVPYVIDRKRNVKFLKTIYANRKLKKKYLK
ncbi:MAG TPA: toxin [Alphaproteobacteria bacterium]|jgi:uncharacterized DUF497 family protein|nr:toxin [Alphaproteobacteria bacterium]